MRRLLSIFLISALLFNILGYYLVYQITVKGYKRHYRQHYYYSVDEIIVAGDKNDNENHGNSWLVDEEFTYSGQKFKLVKNDKKEKTSLVYCYACKIDEPLFIRFKDYMKKHQSQDSPGQQQGQVLILQIIKEAIPEYTNEELAGKEINIPCPAYFFSVKTANPDKIFVPPRSC